MEWNKDSSEMKNNKLENNILPENSILLHNRIFTLRPPHPPHYIELFPFLFTIINCQPSFLLCVCLGKLLCKQFLEDKT